jgi:hypothetical protein
MPLPAFLALAGKAIGSAFAAKNIGTTIAAANAGAQLLTNRAQKKSNLEMYNTQRQDALADWNRQNQYNSPEAQMTRFKEAGLNPHLIYGQMTTAQPIKTPEAKAPNYVSPQADPQDFNILGKQYSLDAARLQNENMEKTGKLIEAQTLKANSETDWKNVYTDFFKSTDPYRREGMNISNLLKGSQYRQSEERITSIQKERQLIVPKIQNLIAGTQLSQQKKAESAQQIINMITANQLLGQKVLTQQQENEFMKKIQAMGIVGQTAASILRIFKGK